MADSKITALASISTSTDPAVDPLVIVDVSDTSMALTGTTKKVTLNNLLSSSPTATGAFSVTGLVTAGSTTITGAATVGTTLGVTGVSSFAAGTAALPALTRTGDTNTGIYYPAADTVAVTTGGTERLRVDSTGKVGINNSSPQGTLTINNANDDAFVLFGNNASALTGSYGAIKASYTGNITTFGVAASLDFIRNESSDGKGGDIYFKTNSAGESGATTKVIINGAGNIKMAVADKGIDFSINSNATGITSELLNDYEEGTWTIGLAFGGGSVGLTTSSNAGRYTKVGRQVTVTGLLVLTSKGSSTGGASVTGLPFSIGNSNDSYPAASLRLNGISYVGAFQAFGTIGSTFISFEQISTLGAVASLTDANFTNASSFIFTLTYFV